jgi:hypothetical protein
MVASLSVEMQSVSAWALVQDNVTVVPVLSTSSVESLLPSLTKSSLSEFNNTLFTYGQNNKFINALQ